MDTNEQTDIQREGTLIENQTIEELTQPNTETETPSESSTENNQTEETPSPEGDKTDSSEPANTQEEDNIPFHEHPRWKKREEEWNNRLEETKAQIRSEYEEKLNQSLQGFQPKEQTVPIPTWFSRLYGNDPEAWNEFESWDKQRQETIKAEAVREYESKQAQETEKVTKANQYIESQITALQSEGKQFDRNELLKVVNDFRPVTDDGNWDLRKAYDILEMQKAASVNPVKSNARKAVASATTSESQPETPKSNVQTNISLRGKGWTDLLD